MKKRISKSLKIALLIAAGAIIAAMTVLMYITVKHPGITEEKTIVVEYSNKMGVSYEVLLKENPLYNDSSLGEEQLYLSTFVDHIKTNFMYEFNVETSSDIQGDYEILVAVEGYTTDEDKVKTIWKKEFILFPQSTFASKDTTLTINKDIDFSMTNYDAFAAQIIEITKLSVPVKATLIMNINLHADTGKGIIEKKYSPSITIPLNTSYFAITKSGIEDTPGAIEETRQVQLPVNKTLVILYGTIIGLAILTLLYLIIFVKGDVQVDQHKKQLNRIFKLHGSRLVAVNSEVGTSFAMYYRMKSIDDLVRMADEIGKPIMYKYSKEPKEITNFYVHDDRSMYTFNIKDAIADKENEDSITVISESNNNTTIPME